MKTRFARLYTPVALGLLLVLISSVSEASMDYEFDTGETISRWLRDQDAAASRSISSWLRNPKGHEVDKALLDLTTVTVNLVALKEDDPSWLKRHLLLFGARTTRRKMPGFIITEVFKRNGIDLFYGLEGKSFRYWVSKK